MLILRRLGETDARMIYENQMRRDFPVSELKSFSSILTLMRKGVYDFLGAYIDGEMIGYALLFCPDEGRVLLLDYLAVRPEVRGIGYGTLLIQALRACYAQQADALMIECERPKAAPNEAEARKRIQFYTRAGAQLTSVRIWLFEVEYSILVLPCLDRSASGDWAKMMLQLYRQMLPDEMFRQNVRLIRG